MSLPLPGYRAIRLLRGSGQSRVFEAVSERDGRRVVAKVFDIEDPSVEDHVVHEFELIRSLDIPGVAVARELLRVGDQLVLVLDYMDGVDLRQYAAGEALALERFWPLAIQLADILARTHARRIIHRDIKPTNVIVDDEGGVHLVDFGISILREGERRRIYDDNVLVGTLPYVSPEQTGRTNRAVDPRSDLYSLGVTFYELLSGRLPFQDLAPLELVHAHLARTPAPPVELRPELPEALSRLILKLLEKAPEHRYQTAAGLAADLRRIRDRVEAGAASEELELGLEDRSPELRLPHQLHGRAEEQAALLDEYRSCVEAGRRRTILLTGPVGVGKSMLLAVLEVAVAGDGGYLARGSFNQLREQPYAGVVEALTGLCEQLLTESDARLDRWQRRLSKGLGSLAGVACEFVPTLALILGPQPSPPPLEPIEARNRLQLALERLLAALCKEQRPLVLAFEDLDRADKASLALFEALVDGSAGPLLIVATVCDRAIEREGPLATLLARPRKRGKRRRRIRRLAIRPLADAAIRELLADALGRPPAELEQLTKVVTRKTGGVPLLIGQFLAELVERRALRFGASGWSWDTDAVERAQIPDDAVALMSAKLSTLTPATRELLAQAACVGPSFDLARLALVSGRPRSELAAACFELVDLGLLSNLGHELRFAHASLRSAALARLSPDEQRALHWTVGRDLLASLDARAGDDALFEAVDHLVAGAPTELDAEARLELAGLDLRAGERALDSGAYEVALRYLDHGVELCAGWIEAVAGEGPEAEHYPLLFGLHFARAQALELGKAREPANEAFDSLLGWCLADHHFGRVVARRCRILRENNRAPEAVELGFAAMRRLGLEVPRSPSRPRLLLILLATRRALRARGREALMNLPACADERTAALIEIVAELKYSTFAVDATLTVYLGAVHLRLLHRHGFHPSMPVALADFGIMVSGPLGRPAEADELIDLALELCARAPDPVRARLGVLAPGAVLTFHRVRGFVEPARLVEEAYPIALECGEFERANLLAMMICHAHGELGTHLRVAERRCREFGEELAHWGSKQAFAVVWLLRCWSVTLLGTSEASEGAGESVAGAELFDVRALGPKLITARGGAPAAVYMGFVTRAMTHLLLGELREALAEALEHVDEVEKVLLNSWYLPRTALVLIVALDRLQLAGEAPPAGAEAAARRSLKLLRRWAAAGPEGYGHYYELAVGLRAAVRGRFEQATAHLDRAWSDARQRGCRWIEGLAAESAAELLEHRDLRLLADGAWRRCWDAYAAWGANTKLELLRVKKPSLFADATLTVASPVDPSYTTLDSLSELSSSPRPDLDGVLRSVGVITEELSLEQVTRRMLDAAMTSAGAGHGMLLLEREGELALVARATSTGEVVTVEDTPSLRHAGERAPASLINFVDRTNQWLVLDDVSDDPRFAADPYLQASGVRSVLALPLLKRERRLGVLVLENRLTSHGFTPAIIETLRLITGQAASVLDNARLHAALTRSEARWRSLVASAPDVIGLLDEHGEIALLNRRGPFASSSADDDPEQDPATVLSLTPESETRWREAVERVLGEGQALELVLEVETAAGESGCYEARLAPIDLDGEGQALGQGRPVRRNAVVLATDVSDRRRAESERRELEAQLRQQQRLDSIGTLASGVAHEINNPIQGIMNYAELIRDRARDPETVEEFAEEITNESHRVAAIVRNLLAFSRQETTQRRELVELSRIVDSTLSLIRSILRKDHITLTIHGKDEHAPRVHCDAQAIQQIVMNLVTNARDALNDRYQGYHERKRIDVRLAQVSDEAGRSWGRVIVEDSGPGIPPEILARIFDPFFTTKARDKGTGLGLAVSHGIARDNGGELSVETILGEGTRFILDLPLAE